MGWWVCVLWRLWCLYLRYVVLVIVYINIYINGITSRSWNIPLSSSPYFVLSLSPFFMLRSALEFFSLKLTLNPAPRHHICYHPHLNRDKERSDEPLINEIAFPVEYLSVEKRQNHETWELKGGRKPVQDVELRWRPFRGGGEGAEEETFAEEDPA